MSRMHRAGMAIVIGALAGGVAATARAQVRGMPLFTNPRYATGLRIHADIGQPTDKGTSLGDLTVVQGGVTLALGPVGLGANIGTLRNNLKSLHGCSTGSTTCNPQSTATVSALAQLRLAGGGLSRLSLSIFGGASTDLSGLDLANLTQEQRDTLANHGFLPGMKEITIPVGAAIGFKIPLGLASLNIWGAPRMNLTRYTGCTGGCPSGFSEFRWAAGADLPIFRIISVRAAYDSGKRKNPVTGVEETTSVWGIGASIGIGGMR